MSQVLGLKSLLPLWEKGFRDGGKRFVSQLDGLHNGRVLNSPGTWLARFHAISSLSRGIGGMLAKHFSWIEFAYRCDRSA